MRPINSSDRLQVIKGERKSLDSSVNEVLLLCVVALLSIRKKEAEC